MRFRRQSLKKQTHTDNFLYFFIFEKKIRLIFEKKIETMLKIICANLFIFEKKVG